MTTLTPDKQTSSLGVSSESCMTAFGLATPKIVLTITVPKGFRLVLQDCGLNTIGLNAQWVRENEKSRMNEKYRLRIELLLP